MGKKFWGTPLFFLPIIENVLFHKLQLSLIDIVIFYGQFEIAGIIFIP